MKNNEAVASDKDAAQNPYN